MNQLYKAEELAHKLNISKQTIWRWGRDGKLETIRIGRTVRFYWEGEENGKG